MSLVGMIVYAATLSLGHLWVVFITAGALGYSDVHSFFLLWIEVMLSYELLVYFSFLHICEMPNSKYTSCRTFQSKGMKLKLLLRRNILGLQPNQQHTDYTIFEALNYLHILQRGSRPEQVTKSGSLMETWGKKFCNNALLNLTSYCEVCYVNIPRCNISVDICGNDLHCVYLTANFGCFYICTVGC